MGGIEINMKEKELDNIAFSNVDVAKLDEEHVYIFRVKQEYLDNVSKDAIREMCKSLSESLKKLNVKHIIILDDIFDIKEIVR